MILVFSPTFSFKIKQKDTQILRVLIFSRVKKKEEDESCSHRVHSQHISSRE